MLRLIVSLVLIAAFVVGATIIESNNSREPMAWLAAQQHVELLWIVDAFALLTLLPVFGFITVQNRLARKSEEISEGRAAHQDQLEKMLYSAEHMDRFNAEQSEQIIILEQTVTDLKAQVTTMHLEAQARQQLLQTETYHLAEKAYAALSGQVEANTRQMEAVNLAMQYQRAEIKQLRQGFRAVQRPHEILDIARLTPSELIALEADEPQRLLGHSESGEQIAETVFFAPTINAQTTFISPMAAFYLAPEFTDNLEAEDSDREYQSDENSKENSLEESNSLEENNEEITRQHEKIQTEAEKKVETAWKLRL